MPFLPDIAFLTVALVPGSTFTVTIFSIPDILFLFIPFCIIVYPIVPIPFVVVSIVPIVHVPTVSVAPVVSVGSFDYIFVIHTSAIHINSVVIAVIAPNVVPFVVPVVSAISVVSIDISVVSITPVVDPVV